MMDVQARLGELKVGPVRAQVEGRDGDRYFVVSGEELLLLDPKVVQRVALRDITKITSDNSGTLRVFAGDRVAIATPSRNFRSQVLKEFFVGVKNAVGHARLTSSAFNLPAIGSSGVDLPPVPLGQIVSQTTLAQGKIPLTSSGLHESFPLTPAQIPPSAPGPNQEREFEASVPNPVPSSSVSTSSVVDVARGADTAAPVDRYSSTPKMQLPGVPLTFSSALGVSEPQLAPEPEDEMAPEQEDAPTSESGYIASPETYPPEAHVSEAQSVIAINTAPPVENTLTVSVPLSSSEGIRRLQLQLDSRVQSVRLMAILSGVFGLLAGALLFTTSAIAALCLISLGAACAAGLYFTSEMFGNLSRGLGEL